MRAGYTLAILGLAILLAGCSGSNHYPDSTKVPAKYKPTINPHPKYFMTVKGFIDPRLNDRIHLTIVAEYDNYNPKCNMWISHLQGAEGPWQIFRDYPVHPDKKGDYHIKIPLDYYQSGKCDWHAAAIRYGDTKEDNGDAQIALIFNKGINKSKIQTRAKTNIICTTTECNHQVSDGFVTLNQFFPFNAQYTYVRSYYLKGFSS